MASKHCQTTLDRLLKVTMNTSIAARIKSANVFNAVLMIRLPNCLLSLPPKRGQCCGFSRCHTTEIFSRCSTTPRSCMKEDYRVVAVARHTMRARSCESNPKQPELLRSKSPFWFHVFCFSLSGSFNRPISASSCLTHSSPRSPVDQCSRCMATTTSSMAIV